MSRQETQIEVARLKAEHSSLEREIADWREWWAQLRDMGQPHFGEMGARLSRFRGHLAAHFAHEQNQKALNLIDDLPPETARRLAELRDEHSGLLAELDRLIERLQACQPQFDCWTDARKEFDAFLTRLDAHENAEEAAYGRAR